MSQNMHCIFAACLLVAIGGLESHSKRVFKPFSEGLKNSDEVIIGGMPAKRGQFPHQGSMFHRGRFRCGCSLLNEQYALTAAHCTEGLRPSKLFVIFGTTKLLDPEEGSQMVRVSETNEHPGYDPKKLVFDVAVMKLHKKVAYTDFIKPVALTGSPDNVQPGTTLVTSGWGLTKDENGETTDLMYVNVTVISTDECARIYGSTAANGAICVKAANTTSVCYGDSGGPLIFPRDDGVRLVGVTSFTHADGCETNNPGGFHRVQLSLSFIREMLNKSQ